MITYHLTSRTPGRTRCGLDLPGTPHLSKVECARCKELSTQPEYAALDSFIKSLESRNPLRFPRSAVDTERAPFNHVAFPADRVGGAHLVLAADAEWRAVTSLPGLEVSNSGSIRSAITKSPRALSRNRKGYMMLKNKRVHRLVLEAFVGPCPPGMECCHNNGNPGDNRIENLRWDTHESNIADRIRHRAALEPRPKKRRTARAHRRWSKCDFIGPLQRGYRAKGERHKDAVLTFGLVSLARWLRFEHDQTAAHIGEWLGVTRSAARQAIAGETWTNVPPHLSLAAVTGYQDASVRGGRPMQEVA